MRRDPRTDPRRGDVVATLEHRLTVTEVDDGVVAFDLRKDARTSRAYRVRLAAWRQLAGVPWTFAVPAPPRRREFRRWECVHCGSSNRGSTRCAFCRAAPPPRAGRASGRT